MLCTHKHTTNTNRHENPNTNGNNCSLALRLWHPYEREKMHPGDMRESMNASIFHVFFFFICCMCCRCRFSSFFHSTRSPNLHCNKSRAIFYLEITYCRQFDNHVFFFSNRRTNISLTLSLFFFGLYMWVYWKCGFIHS